MPSDDCCHVLLNKVLEQLINTLPCDEVVLPTSVSKVEDKEELLINYCIVVAYLC